MMPALTVTLQRGHSTRRSFHVNRDAGPSCAVLRISRPRYHCFNVTRAQPLLRWPRSVTQIEFSLSSAGHLSLVVAVCSSFTVVCCLIVARLPWFPPRRPELGGIEDRVYRY